MVSFGTLTEGQGEQPVSSKPINLSGRWIKDRGASDLSAYEKQLDMLQLGGIQKKTAVRLLTGIDIRQDDQGVTTEFLVPKLSWFKQSETYKWGEDTAMGRRDRKGGEQVAQVKEVPNGFHVDIKWGEPNSGGVKETLTSPEPDVLHVRSITCVGDNCVEALQIYKKQR